MTEEKNDNPVDEDASLTENERSGLKTLLVRMLGLPDKSPETPAEGTPKQDQPPEGPEKQQLSREEIENLVGETLEARLKDIALPKAPNAPDQTRQVWPRTQTEAVQWARDPKRKADLQKAIHQGLEFHQLPKF